jgi:hypothetical protein
MNTDTSQSPKSGADLQERPVSQLVKRLRVSSESLSGEAEAERELAPFSTTNMNSVTLGITAMHEQAAKDCSEAAYALQASEERIADLELRLQQTQAGSRLPRSARGSNA